MHVHRCQTAVTTPATGKRQLESETGKQLESADLNQYFVMRLNFKTI